MCIMRSCDVEGAASRPDGGKATPGWNLAAMIENTAGTKPVKAGRGKGRAGPGLSS